MFLKQLIKCDSQICFLAVALPRQNRLISRSRTKQSNKSRDNCRCWSLTRRHVQFSCRFQSYGKCNMTTLYQNKEAWDLRTGINVCSIKNENQFLVHTNIVKRATPATTTGKSSGSREENIFERGKTNFTKHKLQTPAQYIEHLCRVKLV